MPSRGLAARQAVTRTIVSPMADDDGAVGLLGQLAGFDRQGLLPIEISRDACMFSVCMKC